MPRPGRPPGDDPAAVARFVKQLMRLMGSQPLVPKMDRQCGQFAQLGGEGLHLCGLRSRFAGQRQGISNDDSGNAKAAAQTSDRPKIFALVTAALERKNGLRRKSQFV